MPEITSIDCKILQYKYSIYKAQTFIEYLNSINKLEPSTLRLCHYVTLLSGNLFAINESLFNNKLEFISQYKLFKMSPINISSSVTHVPYDTSDVAVNPLVSLPTAESSVKAVKLLISLYTQCVQGYQKRLAQAVSENKIPEDQLEKYDEIIKLLLNGSDVDLHGSPDFSFEMTRESALTNDPTFMEATLIDIDIKMIFSISSSVQKSLDKLKVVIDRYKALKAHPKSLAQIKDNEYILHKIFLITLRLNDLYVVLRRFGRKVYLSNFTHLNDQKFLSSANQSLYFKSSILKSIDDMFNSAKKNGVLIATLTRLIRANSKFEVNVKNALDFTNFVSQGHFILSNTVAKFEEFGVAWVSLELRFRKAYNLPKLYVSEIYERLQNERLEKERVQREKQLKEKSVNQPVSQPVSSIRISKPTEKPSVERFPVMDEDYIDKTKKMDLSDTPSNSTKERSIFNRPSRSSSVSSNSSTSTGLARKTSINSVNSNTINSATINSTIKPQTRTTANGRTSRPSSMIFLNQNGSNTSLSKPAAVGTTRTRSNSQPISPEAVKTAPVSVPYAVSASAYSPATSPLNSRIASSGAAAALKHNSAPKPYQSLSPSNTIKRKSSVSRSASVKGSPNGKVQPIIEEETKKLSANQRLQHHLKQAAKQGSLMTQEKEVFDSVVFDPNDPSAVNLRRYSDKKDDAGSVSPPPRVNGTGATNGVGVNGVNSVNGTVVTAPGIPSVSGASPFVTNHNSKPKRKTRDEVTKLNTKRNSELVTLSSESSKPVSEISSDSTETSESITSPKQVRFIGVPEYTAAEDAPVSYSAKILKNFAVFKTPRKPGFKTKDQMLKKEESLSFKTLNHQNLLNPGVTSPAKSIEPKSLSNSLQHTKLKIKSKLI